jgi:hypothetical protein
MPWILISFSFWAGLAIFWWFILAWHIDKSERGKKNSGYKKSLFFFLFKAQ